MRYSVEPRNRIYVKGYGLLSFSKNIGTHLSNKYGQRLLDTTKKSTTDAIKLLQKKSHSKSSRSNRRFNW